jgi:hypothetical protein
LQADLDEVAADVRAHTYNSVLRERIVEHVFVGEMLRRLWQLGNTDVEVLRSEFDRGGYDLVVASGAVVRHIQFKSSLVSSTTAEQSLSVRLAEKPSGCVIWVVVYPDLSFSHYLWFGGAPGDPLEGLPGLKIARQARANAQGFKAERPDHRRVPKRMFERLQSMDDVLNRLFGSAVSAGTSAKS